MTTFTPTILPSSTTSPYQTAALALSLVQLSFGLNGLFRPTAHLQSLNLPVDASLLSTSPTSSTTNAAATTNPLASKYQLALMRIWGIRNLTLGLFLIFMWRRGDRELLGNAIAAVTMVPIVDGFAVRGVVGKEMSLAQAEGQHWGFVPVLVGVAGGLWGMW
jgi:hypothetical protein